MIDQLRYPATDIAPQAGDVVRFLNHPDTMTVEEVIATRESREKWGLQESGVMMIGPKYGRIFDQLGEHSEVEFVERSGTES